MDITIHEYIEILNNELDSRFPNTTRVANDLIDRFEESYRKITEQ